MQRAAEVVERGVSVPAARRASARSSGASTTLPPRPAASAAARTRSSSVRRTSSQSGRGAGAVLRDEQPGEGELVELGRGASARSSRRDAGARAPSSARRPAGPARCGPAPAGPGGGARRGRSPAGRAARPASSIATAPSRSPRRRRTPGRGGVPAVPVLRQRRPFAELRRRLQVLRGGVEVALLAEHVGQPDVQVPGRRQTRPGGAPRGRRAPARGAGGPRRGVRGRATWSARTTVPPSASVTCRPRRRLRTASPNVSTAVARSPAAQAARPRNPAAAPRAKWSSGPARSSGAPGVPTVPRRRRGPAPPRRGRPRSSRAAPRSSSSRAGRASAGSAASAARHRRRPGVVVRSACVGDVEPGSTPVEVALGQPRQAQRVASRARRAHDVLGQGVQPVAQGPVLPLPAQRRAAPARRGRRRARRRRRRGRGGSRRSSVPCSACQPAGGAGAAARTGSGSSAREPGAQRVGEQVVVAPPLPLVVERDDEQVRPLEASSSCCPSVRPVSASHSGPVSSSSTEVSRRKARTSSGWVVEHLLERGSPGRTGGCR